ncbi:MAG TPA: type II secretion system protein GspN [Candidatus Binataceae bacterium]|nr:type II secretion system protein GspN [Candidatus Binataceae bacterium]
MAEPQPRAASYSRLTYAAYAIIGLSIFFAFLAARFPYPQALSDGLAPMGYSITIGSQGYSFPFGAELDNVTVAPLSPPGAAVLSSPRVIVAPALLSILIFHPGLHVKADLYGGNINTVARPSAGGTLISFKLRNLQLANLKLLDVWGLGMAGALSGKGTAWVPPVNPVATSGNLELDAESVNLTPPPPLPAVAVGQAEATIGVQNQIVTIQNFKTSGGDIEISATGTVQLAADPRNSELDIQFTLNVTPDAQQRLAFLLAGLPHPPGPTPYQLTGTFQAPRITG